MHHLTYFPLISSTIKMLSLVLTALKNYLCLCAVSPLLLDLTLNSNPDLTEYLFRPDKFVKVKGWCIPLEGKIFARSHVHLQRSKRKGKKKKSDKLSVFKYQLLNRYFQIYQYFILTKNLESLHYLFL